MADVLLAVQGLSTPVAVRSFEGDERLHRPGRFGVLVTLDATYDEDALEALVGQPATLRFAGHAEARRVGGVIAEVALRERTATGFALVELELTSRLALLGLRRTSRVHQGATIPEILARTLDLHGLPHAFDFRQPHAKRDDCVQYRETDLAFVTRLCAEEGLSFHVLDGDEEHGELVVFGDDVAAFRAITGEPTLDVPVGVVGSDALQAEEHHLRLGDVRRRGGSGTALVRRYDPMRPRTSLASQGRWEVKRGQPGEARPVEVASDVADDPGLWYEHHADDDAVSVEREHGAALLAQRRRRSFELTGETTCARLGPGRWFELTGSEWESARRRWIVGRVRHRYQAEGLAGSKVRYEARLTATPGNAMPLPRAPRRTPAQVAETAVVVGPPGEEIHADEHGRVRVQFHWDLDGQLDGASSAWIRVAQPWAGNGFGATFLPRVGMEVLVTFVGGDPDRPVITGCLHHAAHPPPFRPPIGQTKTGILSRSSPGGDGHNEISLDDQKGRELVRVRSQRDLELTSEDASRFEVGTDRTAIVGGTDRLVVEGSREETLGSHKREVRGASESMSLGDVDEVFMGRRELLVQDIATTRYGAGATTTCDGPMTVHVEGEASLVVGTGETLASASVDGRLVLGASKTLTLRAEEEIVLQVGTTRLIVSSAGIRLEGKNVALRGETVTAEGDGPSLTLGTEAELLTQKLTILTKKGGLVMEEETKLWGKPLALNPPPDDASAEKEEEEPELKPFKVKLTDPEMEPYADKRWVLFADGRRLEGATAADGGIDVEIPKAAAQVDITCWLDEYPTGRQKTWSVAVEDLPAASSLRGAMLRLHNLGYFSGAIGESAGPNEKAALRWFQKEHELEPTGDLDGETASELARVHGS